MHHHQAPKETRHASARELDPPRRRGHGAVQAVLYGRAGLGGPERLQDLGVLRSPQRFAGRLLRPRRARRDGGRERGGQRLQRRRVQLRRAQRGPRRRGSGRGQEGRRGDPQARGEAAVGRVRRILCRPGWLHLEHRLQRRRKGPALRRVASKRCCVDRARRARTGDLCELAGCRFGWARRGNGWLMSAHGTVGPGQRVVVAGGGFAGFHAARRLGRLARGGLDVVLVNPTDYFLYLPLLPEVAAGILDPRTVAAPLAATRRGVRHVLGAVTDIDLGGRQLAMSDPEGNRRAVGYDQLVIALGSVNRLLPIPGVADHAHGFRSLAEALYLRDHLLRQIELADISADRAERDARCTFVVVGAGYTGTEVAAQLQLLSRVAARRRAGLADQKLRWMLIDLAPRIMPELDPRLAATATRSE